MTGPFITVGTTAGPPNARTDPDGLRFYTWQGRELPSATTVRRMAGVNYRLHLWIVGQVVDAAAKNVWTLVKMLTRKRRPRERVLEKNRLAEAASWLRAKGNEERDRSAQLGTAVHDACATDVPLDELAPELRPRVGQYRRWLEVSGAERIAAEFQVFNLTEGYAGSGDLLCRFPDGSYWLVDLKTGNETYAEHAIQLIFYLMAEFVGRDDVVDEYLTAVLHAVSGMAILHLSDDGWEFRSIRFDQETWDAARGLLRFAVWTHVHPDIASVTVGSRRSAA